MTPATVREVSNRPNLAPYTVILPEGRGTQGQGVPFNQHRVVISRLAKTASL